MARVAAVLAACLVVVATFATAVCHPCMSLKVVAVPHPSICMLRAICKNLCRFSWHPSDVDLVRMLQHCLHGI